MIDLHPATLSTICIVAALIAAAIYALGRRHGRQAARDEAWMDPAPEDDDGVAVGDALIQPRGAGGPAGGGRRR